MCAVSTDRCNTGIKTFGRLGESGLSGAYNSTIAKLILSSNHGMHEKSEVENKSEYVVQVTEVESRL